MKISKSILNGGLFSIFSFLNQGISFLLLIVLAKFILPGDYGQLSLFTTVVTFLGYFIALSTNGYESISYFKNSRIDFKRDFTAIHIIAIIIFAFFTLVILIFGNPLGKALKLSTYLLWIASIYSLLNIFTTMLLSYLRVSEKVIYYGLVSCGNAIINAGLALFFVVSLQQGWLGKVYSQLVCSIATTIIAIIIYYRKELVCFSDLTRERFKTMIVWGIPLIPHMAAIWVRQGLDRYIIDANHTILDVGLFSFALNLTNVIIIIGSSFNNSFSVEQYQVLSSELSGQQKIDSLLSKSKKMAGAFALAAVATVIVCTVIVNITLPQYVDALPYFWVLAGYGFIQCLYFLIVNYLFYYKKNKEIMYTTFGTSILHLGLSLLLTKYSLFYTCGIYIFIQALIVTIIYLRCKKVVRENLLTN